MATPPLAEQMLAAVIAAKDQALAAKDQVLAAKDQTLAAKDQDLARADQALKFVIDSNTVQIDAYKMQIYQKDLTLSKHMAILHARSVIELTATIFCKNDAKINTHSGMIKKFLNGQVFKRGTQTLTEAADATREMLDEQPGWSLGTTKVLESEITNIYPKLSKDIHLPDTLETGWCVGGPGDQGAAHVIVSTGLLKEVGDRLALEAQSAPMELVILNPSYLPFKKFLKHPVDGWSFQDYTS